VDEMEEVQMARKISLYFTILCVLFVAMSPQFMGFILPLLFLLPIFMAIAGLKHRKKSGYLVAMGIVPLALAISVMGMRYSLDSFSNMTAEVTRIGTQYRLSVGTAQGLIMACAIISAVMAIMCGFLFFKLFKNKYIFK
jgi:hypothetical protein